MKVPFGKFRGSEVGDLPDSYLRWMLGIVLESPPLHAEVQAVAVARGLIDAPASKTPPTAHTTTNSALDRELTRQVLTSTVEPDRLARAAIEDVSARAARSAPPPSPAPPPPKQIPLLIGNGEEHPHGEEVRDLPSAQWTPPPAGEPGEQPHSEWEAGVVVGVEVALSALREHPVRPCHRESCQHEPDDPWSIDPPPHPRAASACQALRDFEVQVDWIVERVLGVLYNAILDMERLAPIEEGLRDHAGWLESATPAELAGDDPAAADPSAKTDEEAR